MGQKSIGIISGVVILGVVLLLGVLPFLYYVSIQPAFACDDLQNEWLQQCEEQKQLFEFFATPGIYFWTLIQ